MKLFIYFYADDTAILSETPSYPQLVLNFFLCIVKHGNFLLIFKNLKSSFWDRTSSLIYTLKFKDKVIDIVKKFYYLCTCILFSIRDHSVRQNKKIFVTKQKRNVWYY